MAAASSSRPSIVGLVLVVLAVGGATQWWQARSEAKLGEQLAALARPGDIRMLSSLTCTFCTAARQWMTQHRVPFDECFIERDRDCAALYDATRAPGTPVVLVRGKPQLGFDAQRVIAGLS